MKLGPSPVWAFGLSISNSHSIPIANLRLAALKRPETHLPHILAGFAELICNFTAGNSPCSSGALDQREPAKSLHNYGQKMRTDGSHG